MEAMESEQTFNLDNRKGLIVGILLGAVAALGVWSNLDHSGVLQNQSSLEVRKQRLLDQVQHGSQKELAKIMYVLEIYKNRDLTVRYNDTEFNINVALETAHRLISSYYENQVAEDFIQAHLYRTDQNKVIYINYADGSRRPLRDVFIEELGQLPIDE